MRDDLVFLHSNHRPTCIDAVDKRFEYYTLQLISAGSVELYYDSRRYELHNHALWPCYPGPRVRFHEWPRGRAWHHRHVAVVGQLASRWALDGIWPTTPLNLELIELPVYEQKMDRIVDLSNADDKWSFHRAINLLESLLLDWTEAGSHQGLDRPSWLATTIHRLNDTSREVGYEDLAREVDMSLSTLQRRFRDATGSTLHAYRLTIRLAKAQVLLAETGDAIKAVATKLGYRDVYYFSRQFKQLTGHSPGQYRRRHQLLRTQSPAPLG